MAEKGKKDLTPEDVARIRAILEEIRRDLRDVLTIIQSKLGQKPA